MCVWFRVRLVSLLVPRLFVRDRRWRCSAKLEQEQPDGSVTPIVYVCRAIRDLEMRWIPLDLEAGSIIWVIKRLRGYV